MRGALAAFFAAFMSTGSLTDPTVARAPEAAEAIVANDNRAAAGRLRNGVLTLALEIRQGALHTEEDAGPSVPALAFAEVGKPLRVPGPLIRVPQGTELHVTVRNPFRDSLLYVAGLADHGTSITPVAIPAGKTHEFRFKALTPGTYYYWASTGDRDIAEREWFESQLTGAFIVDPPGARTDDRIFVLGLWFRDGDTSLPKPREPQDVMVINGKSWPHTERFTYTEGDTVRWRWINPTVATHPMHLHGFYYLVESRGNWQKEKTFLGEDRPQVVTHLMMEGETMKMQWIPERAGNWVFHCHFAFHVSHWLALPRDSAHADHSTSTNVIPALLKSAQPAHSMAGLVLGMSVRPGPKRPAAPLVSPTARNIRLIAQSRDKKFGKLTGFGYVTQEGAVEPKADSVLIPGPMLVLKRGEPVRITVVNHLAEPTAVHWHGIELESFPDGVPGWSGLPGRIMSPIAPKDSFIAEFVPPRAGTFIYHTHNNEQLQLGSGLYGALIVVPPDKPYDPQTERLIIAGGAGPADSMPDFQSPGYVNGRTTPPPMHLKIGTTYRLRLININPDWRVIFSLQSPDGMESWKALAVDGADLPASQMKVTPAWYVTGPGMTADFEFTPKARADLRLEVKTMLPGWIIPIDVYVR